MVFGDDRRGQSVQVGAVLLFGILIMGMAMFQAYGVPTDNKQTEFDHNQRVQSDLLDLRNAILAAGAGEGHRPVSISYAPQYKKRMFYVNPGTPTGVLRTVGTDDDAVAIRIENATAEGEVGDFWNGSALEYETGVLVYIPQYAEYDSAPTTTYEHSAVVNRHDDAGDRVVADQRFIDGKRVSLVALDGSLSGARAGSGTLKLSAESASTRRVALYNETDPITISLPTRLSNETWTELLAEEHVDAGGHVEGWSLESHPADGFDRLVVRLEPGVVYEVQASRVTLSSNVSPEGPAYITDVDGDGDMVAANATGRLVVETRDRFNNPVSGVTTNASGVANPSLTVTTDDTFGGDSVEFVTSRSNEEGQVELAYTAPETITSADMVEVTVNNEEIPGPAGNVTFSVQVIPEWGESSNSAYNVYWENPTSNPDNDGLTCDDDWDYCNLDMAVSDTIDLTAATDPSVEGVDLDFLSRNTTVGTLSPTSGTTGADGKANTTFTAEEIGETILFVTGGSSGDSVTVNADYDMADALYRVDGTVTSDQSETYVEFEFGATAFVEVEKFSLESRNALEDELNTSNDVAVSFTGTGSVKTPGSATGGPPYNVTNSTTPVEEYPFGTNPEIGTEARAVLEIYGTNVKIDPNGFAPDRESADIIVTLYLADGTEKEFYLDVDLHANA